MTESKKVDVMLEKFNDVNGEMNGAHAFLELQNLPRLPELRNSSTQGTSCDRGKHAK